MTEPPPILVLNFNGWEDTEACLSALCRFHPPQKVWLIDNGSQRDRTAELAARFAGIRTLRLERNLGWAGGYNAALSKVFAEGCDRAVLLNNDTRPAAGLVEPLTAAMDADPGLAAVGAVILEADGETVWFDGEYGDAAGDAGPGIAPATEVNGAAMLISRAAFEAVGPFDERFFLYHEEADWCRRAKAAGWRLAVATGARVVHLREASDENLNAAYYRARNLFLCRRKGFPDRPDEDETDLFLRLADMARGLSPEARAAALQGMADGLRGRFGERGEAMSPATLAATLAPVRIKGLGRRAAAKLRRG